MKIIATSKVSLHKGDLTATLLGLCHVAPPSFDEKINAEIAAAHAAQHTVFIDTLGAKRWRWHHGNFLLLCKEHCLRDIRVSLEECGWSRPHWQIFDFVQT